MENYTVYAECNDSTLSIFSNVIGILTGVLASLAAVYVRFGLVRHAAGEIAQLLDQTRPRVAIFKARIDAIRAARQETSPLVEQSIHRLQESIVVVMTTISRLWDEFDNPDRGRTRFLGIGIAYWLIRDNLKERVNQMVAQYDILVDALEVSIYRETYSSEDQLEKVLGKLCELEQKVSMLEISVRDLSEHHDSGPGIQLDDGQQGSHAPLEEVLRRPIGADFDTEEIVADQETK